METATCYLLVHGKDLEVDGDLTVTGNDIKSNGGTTVFSLSGANATAAGNFIINGDLTVSGTNHHCFYN